jgi:hypothetical protein
MAVVDALRDGIGAEAVGLFDDDRAELHAASHPTHPNFWEAFGGLPCLDGDWSAFYLELRTNKRVETTCACGAGHRLCGYLVHDRWALLVVAHQALIPGAPTVAASALKVLSGMLPPARKREVAAQIIAAGGEPTPTQTGIPVWWVRKMRQ